MRQCFIGSLRYVDILEGPTLVADDRRTPRYVEQIGAINVSRTMVKIHFLSAHSLMRPTRIL